jgi:hypothetical protein
VITLLRHVVSFACAVMVACSGLFAQKRSTELNSTGALTPELLAFLAAQPKWSASVATETGFGFKDNLLLSHAAEERSALARGSVEVLLLRVPGGRFEYSMFVQADGTHFFSGTTVDHEANAWAQSEIGYRLTDTLKFTVPVTGYYCDQVFDVSDTDVERLVAELKVTGGMIGPTVRWTFHPSWFVEAQAVGERKRYDDHANDGEVGETSVRLGWMRSDRVELRLIGTERWRNFARRARYSAAGREIFGTKLKIREREGQARCAITWDEAGRWQTVTRVSLLQYRDNGSGYFNYREQKVAHDVGWKSDWWQFWLGGSARRIDFGVQTVGLGIDPPARLKDEFSADFRAERKLTKQWTIFATYSWERTRSNDLFASYNVNEGLLGMHWSWEK